MVYDSFRKGITMEKCKTKTIQTGLDTFRHNQAYLKNYVNRAYTQPCYIQNPEIFKTRNTFRTWFIQNPGVMKTLAYSKPKAYLDIYDLRWSVLWKHLTENSLAILACDVLYFMK